MTTARQTRRTAKKDAWREPFLATLRQTGNVSESARTAGVGRTFVYAERERDEAFAALWDDAVEDGMDTLEAEARRRGLEGWDEPVFGRVGKDEDGRVGTVRKYSDTLLIFMLKGGRPEKYRERSDVRHSGKIDLGKLSDDELRAILES